MLFPCILLHGEREEKRSLKRGGWEGERERHNYTGTTEATGLPKAGDTTTTHIVSSYAHGKKTSATTELNFSGLSTASFPQRRSGRFKPVSLEIPH